MKQVWKDAHASHHSVLHRDLQGKKYICTIVIVQTCGGWLGAAFLSAETGKACFSGQVSAGAECVKPADSKRVSSNLPTRRTHHLALSHPGKCVFWSAVPDKKQLRVSHRDLLLYLLCCQVADKLLLARIEMQASCSKLERFYFLCRFHLKWALTRKVSWAVLVNYASKTPEVPLLQWRVAWLATKDAETKTGGDSALKFPHKLAVTP